MSTLQKLRSEGIIQEDDLFEQQLLSTFRRSKVAHG